MKYYKLRIDTDDRKSVVSLLNVYSSRYLISIENEGTENTHCHAYLESDSKQATIRAAIRKNYGGGNGSYSLKELDEQHPLEYLAYCIKENNYVHNLSSDVLSKAVMYDAKIKSEMKEKKKNRRTILQKMVEEFKYEEGKVYVSDVITDVIEYYRKNEILVREFAMISQVQTLLLRFDPQYRITLSGNIHRAIDKSRF